MKKTYAFEIQSQIAADREEVWRHATCMPSVNLEFRPWIRMTYPAEHLILDVSPNDLQKTLFRSRILLFGLLPVEIYNVTFEEFEPGHRFLERSPTLTQHWWQHERTLTDVDGGCRVTDRVAVFPRMALLGSLSLWLARLIFVNRHRNLRRLYGRL